MKRTIECKYCDSNVNFPSAANFVLYCPHCKREILMECEYGFGPVTPCAFLLGEEIYGTVMEDFMHDYILELNGKCIKLKEKYLKALEEADRIVRRDLKPELQNETFGQLEVKKKRGSLCFYGDWFGRPCDNCHVIRTCSYFDNVLEIVFDEWERLIVIEPIGIVNTETEFYISDAKEVKWSWYPYGTTEKMKRISYEYSEGMVYKRYQNQKEVIARKAPGYAVSMY